MEAWTSGRVSWRARRAWQARSDYAARGRTFERISGGYRLIGWESEIAMCRAMGRGAARGDGAEMHRYDAANQTPIERAGRMR